MTKTIELSDAAYSELMQLINELSKLGEGAAFSAEFTLISCIRHFRDSLNKWGFRRAVKKKLQEIAAKHTAEQARVFRE